MNLDVMAFPCSYLFLASMYAIAFGASEYYEKRSSFNGVVSNSIEMIKVNSVLECGHQCLTTDVCESFFFVGTNKGCQLVNSTMYDPNINTTSQPGSSYYVQRSADDFGQCPPNDDIFRTVTLVDNTAFTFRVMKINASETEAIQGCINEGAYLAKVLTQAKFEFIRNLLNCTSGYHEVPFYRVDGNNHNATDYYDYAGFTTVDGDVIPAQFWDDNYYTDIEYNCILMYITNNWYFLRSPCYHPTYYICEK